MPFIPDKETDQVRYRIQKSIGTLDLEAEDPREVPFNEQVVAAFRMDTTLGSLIAREPNLPDNVISDEYNVWNQLTEAEKLDERFVKFAIGADNDLQLAAVRKQFAREQVDRETLAKSGILASVVASVAEPINYLVPGAVAYKTYKTGASVLKNAAITSSVNAATQAGIEPVLHYNQITRSAEESAATIASAALLGGIFGAAPNVIDAIARRSNTTLRQAAADIDQVMNPEGRRANGENSAFADGTLSAGEVEFNPVVRGTVARKFTRLAALDPLFRTITSDAKATRRASYSLAENPLAIDGGRGQAVETLVKTHDRKLGEALLVHSDAFTEYQKSGGKYKRKVFNEAVSRQLRNPSPDAHPAIAKAAQGWKEKLYDPMLKEFQAQQLLPDDIEPTTAVNYLNRIWNREKVATQRPELLDRIVKWLDEQQTTKTAVKSDVESGVEALQFTQTRAKLTAGRLERAKTRLALTSRQLEELQRTEKESVKRAFATKDQTQQTRINEIDAEIEALKKTRTKAKRGQKGKIDTAVKKLRAERRGIRKVVRGRDPGLRGQRRELATAEARQRQRLNDLHKRESGLKHRVTQLEDELARSQKKLLQQIDDLENRVADWPGKTANALRSALKARDGRAATKASKTLIQTIRKITKADISDIDTHELADEIINRIMSSPDGRLPYDYKIGQSVSQGVSDNLSSPFRNRSFNIPDHLVDFTLENDIEVLSARYLKQTAPDVELVKKFGDVDMKAVKGEINDEYTALMKAATSEKERLKLQNAWGKDIRDIAGMRDRIRGRYNVEDAQSVFVRAQRVARDMNYMRLLGGVVAASFSDIARIVMAEGLTNTFRNGVVPLIQNLKNIKVNTAEANSYGIAVRALQSRAEVLAEVANYTAGGTAFERGVRAAATKFSDINLMNQWTNGMKQLHLTALQNRLIPELKRGTIDSRLVQLGIDEADALNIAGQLNKYATKQGDTWLANIADWDNQGLATMWAGAMRKESDRVIIMPGQDKPLFMSTELGQTLFQFKSFMYSATFRVTASVLQQQDKHYVQGLMALVTMGMMTYAFKEWDAGRELSDDPAVWVMEGIDRSGALGYLMEASNVADKIAGVGLRGALGIAGSPTRYASRSALDSLVGPTFGLSGDIIGIASALVGDREWTDSDTRAFRRLLPGQNLSIIRQFIDEAEEPITKALQ
jgi:hypothetical protein